MTPRRHSIRLPNVPESLESHELVFYDWGNPDSAKTVFCVHGLTRNAHDFDLLAPAIAATGRRVFSINMAGRGESEWLRDPMGYNYATYIADCLAIMDNFHLRSVEWVGTSMGGIIGMSIAASHKDRIKKLVLNDVGSFLSSASLRRIYDYVSTMPKTFTDRADADQYLRSIYQGFGITDPMLWQQFVDNSLIEKDRALRYACDPAIAEPLRVGSKEYTEVQDVNLAHVWQQISVPTFILHGADSEILISDTIRAMKLSNPYTESVTLPGIGHAPSLMSEDQIRLVTNWLSGSAAMMLASGL